MQNHLNTAFYGVTDHKSFCESIQAAIHKINCGGVFAGDNLFTFGRNLGFLDDERLMTTFNAHAETVPEKAILWRNHVQCWAAQRTMALDGDMLEAACYKGISARIIADYVDLKSSDKSFYIYDLFEHDDSMVHHSLPELGAGLFDQVKALFTDLPNVIVSKGFVPQIFDEVVPEKIAFLHIDMNNAEAEIAALEYLWDRIVPGASIVLDDYGWLAYRAQKMAEDPFFAARGYQVLELPTGQGLVIK